MPFFGSEWKSDGSPAKIGLGLIVFLFDWADLDLVNLDCANLDMYRDLCGAWAHVVWGLISKEKTSLPGIMLF